MKNRTYPIYQVSVPPTWEQGSYNTRAQANYCETMRENALHDYNQARSHDGLAPVRRMPAGTKYSLIKNTRTV